MKFSTAVTFASIAGLAAAQSITYVDETTTPVVTTSMVSTVNSTSTPYTTSTMSTLASSALQNLTSSTSANSTSHVVPSFEGAAVNQKIAGAGIGAIAGGIVMALL